MSQSFASYVIDDERPADASAREALLDRAMGPDRLLKPSERLRRGRVPAIALVARSEARPPRPAPARGLDAAVAAPRCGDAPVGTVRLWHVDAGGRPALLLGPLAVAPEVQGGGIGRRLMRSALNRAAAAGHGAVILVGDPGYYSRFGFAADLTATLLMPGPVDRRRFLALELRDGALGGAAGMLVAAGAPLPTLAELPAGTLPAAMPHALTA